MRYRDHWTIEKLFWDDLSYTGTHDDFDGAPIHSQSDDCPDHRCFTGRTIADVQAQIDQCEAEQDDRLKVV